MQLRVVCAQTRFCGSMQGTGWPVLHRRDAPCWHTFSFPCPGTHDAGGWAAGAAAAVEEAERISAPSLLAAGAEAGEKDTEAARLRAQLQRLKGQVVATAAAAEEEQERLQKVLTLLALPSVPPCRPASLPRFSLRELAERYDKTRDCVGHALVPCHIAGRSLKA